MVKNLNFSTRSDSWQQVEQWGLGSTLLYESRSDPNTARFILFLGRLFPIAVTVTLCWLIGWWATKRWGGWSGVMAAGLFSFDPTVLGHGHLVTTDMAVTLGFVATLVLFERWLQAPTWRQTMLVSTVFALTQVSKFSAIILWLIVPAILFIRLFPNQHRLDWRWAGRMMLSLLVIVPLVTWVIYGFEVKRFDSDARIRRALDAALTAPNAGDEPPLTAWLVNHAKPQTMLGDVIQKARHLPIPAYSYFQGLIETSNHNFWGHTAFLLGEIRVHGWWYYFPVAMAVKLPLLTWGGLLLSLGLLLRRTRWRWNPASGFWILVLPPAMFLLWSMTGHINIGVRHVMPVIVFIPLWIGAAGARLRRAWQMPIAAVVVVGIGLTALLAWPHTLGYFNAAAGGTAHGHTILQDSNLDWNQDTWRLRSYLTQHHISTYGLAIPGNRKELFFDEAGYVMTDEEYAHGERPVGTYYISAGALYDTNNPFHWLWNETPTTVVGTTIYEYRFR